MEARGRQAGGPVHLGGLLTGVKLDVIMETKGGDYMGQDKELRHFNYWLSKILPNVSPYDFKNKGRCIGSRVAYTLARTQAMFKYDGLPDTIPRRSLELYFQINGFVGFAEHKNDLYAFFGGLGGEPDPNYMPTDFIVSNPALKLSRTYKINKDCVIVPNDSMYYGLMPMLQRYATMEAEAELSLFIATINSRIIDLISAADERTKASAEVFIKRIVDGDLSIVAETPFFDGMALKVQPYGERGSETITNLIEEIQYLKASAFNELGLNANYNMKRESLNTSESQMNNDALMPLVDDMLRCRKEGLEKVNAMFGTNITVDFDSSWKQNVEEMKAELDAMKNPMNPMEQGGDNDVSGGEKDAE